MIEVLLTQRVDKLGEPGDLVKVADGFARNYLFPRQLAVLPTPHAVNQFKRVRASRAAELQQREEWARAAKERLDGFALTFKRRAHDGKLYSSVRREEIAEEILQKLNIELEKSKIDLETPIATLGTHAVKINLYKDIAASVRVHIEEEASPSSSR